MTSTRRTRVAILAALLLTAPARANHGPGTSGSGATTASGETLKQGRLELSLRNDTTWFESIGRSEAEQHALQSDGFDAISRTVVQSLGLSYGLTDDVQVGAQVGYYWGSDFIDAESDGMGGVESATADPSGMTDLWLQAKWRVARGPAGHLALIGGVKLPTGDSDERLSNGELLEASSQPGTGAFDGQLGLAWSRYLTPRVTVDASGIYTLRGEHDGFRVGDRVDLGLAGAYRLTEDIRAHPAWSVSAELLGTWLAEDDADGARNPNSGGWTVYLAAGLRTRFNDAVALTVAPAVPIYQDLNGDQAETRARLAVDLSWSF